VVDRRELVVALQPRLEQTDVAANLGDRVVAAAVAAKLEHLLVERSFDPHR
jgi:hypothetical protein